MRAAARRLKTCEVGGANEAAIADARQAVDTAAVEYALVCEGESEMRRKMRPDLVVEGAVRVHGGDSSRGS